MYLPDPNSRLCNTRTELFESCNCITTDWDGKRSDQVRFYYRGESLLHPVVFFSLWKRLSKGNTLRITIIMIFQKVTHFIKFDFGILKSHPSCTDSFPLNCQSNKPIRRAFVYYFKISLLYLMYTITGLPARVSSTTLTVSGVNGSKR